MTLPVAPYQPPAFFDQQAAIPTTATLQNAASTNITGTDFDITGMATVQLLVSPTSYTGTVTFWASIDGTTFNKILGNQMDTTTVADNIANPGSTASIWTFETAGLTKIRAALTNSGGTSVTVTGAASPLPNSVPLGVTLSSAVLAAGTAVVGSVLLQSVSGTALGADVSNTELKVSTYVKTSAAGDTALTVGQTTMANSLPVAIASNQSAIPTSPSASATGGYSYTRMTTAATALIKSGAGTLHKIVINTPVANGTVEFDDALTNTTPIIGKITLPATLLSDGPREATYDLAFTTGLSITTTGTMDITVVWK